MQVKILRRLIIGIMLIICTGTGAFAQPKVKKSPFVPLTPNDSTSVVYFVMEQMRENTIWDGENPVGKVKTSVVKGIVPYVTSPGTHYFMVDSSKKWNYLKIDLEPNKEYYLSVSPNAGVDFAVSLLFNAKGMLEIHEMDPELFATNMQMIIEGNRYAWDHFAFTDEWRSKVKEKEKKEARKQLERVKAETD